MSYILLIASGLRFTGILLKIQQEIVYTVAVDLRRRALHFEQIWRRSELKPRRKMRAGKSADRQTDRQTAFCLYIVDVMSKIYLLHH